MVIQKIKCSNCFHVISNPICPDCFIKEISSWLYDIDISSEARLGALKKISLIVFESDMYPADIECILCKNREVNLCSYCFLIKVKDILEKVFIEKGVDNKFLEQFEDLFNYSIWLR